MAGIQLDPKSKRYRIRFRYQGQEFKRSLRTKTEKEARAIKGRIEETISLIERGRLEVPEDADPATFILTDGKQTTKVVAKRKLSLGELLRTYDDSRIEKSKEETTIVTEKIHLKHLRKYLPLRNVAQSVVVSDLQHYVTNRLKNKWRGRAISVDTVREEVATFRAI